MYSNLELSGCAFLLHLPSVRLRPLESKGAASPAPTVRYETYPQHDRRHVNRCLRQRPRLSRLPLFCKVFVDERDALDSCYIVWARASYCINCDRIPVNSKSREGKFTLRSCSENRLLPVILSEPFQSYHGPKHTMGDRSSKS